ncbi:membrane metallo-endopeptidase-like 1 isoform X2 [Odontomachus brunneus]|uniref:membrane metallo-endopeptidase-like 1 isoform X2 n=1 Tax=Odontomachus brunneus TaxID=486640 RepID=UPI0013F2821D|nr:membrane metallo-endopeptidase-like 1 isoform X2 [Odontomachus brunneus]
MYLLPLLFCITVVEPINVFNRTSTDYIVCESDACREIGKAIQRGINNSLDPCANFYDYGCGSWPTNNPIPPSELQWDMDDLYILKINRRVKALLEEESEYDELPPIKMLKQYYRSCMDEDAIERQGLAPIMALLESNGGWPVLMKREGTNLNFTWQKIDNVYNWLFGGSSFFKISHEADEVDSTRNILTVSIDDDTSFTEDELDEEDNVSLDTSLIKMRKTIKAFATYKRIKRNKKNRNKEITRLREFQERFEDITECSNEETLQGMEINQTKMTISELQKYYDSAETQHASAKINWLETIQFIYQNVNVSIDASEPVLVYNKELLHELAYLLDDTSPRVLVNFIQWNIVNKFMPYLNKELRDINFESNYQQYNVTEQKPRWETCVKDIPLIDALSYLYTRKYNLTNNIKAVIEMIEEIRTEMKVRILHSKWINNSTKEFMIAKMDNLILQIGYPKWYNNQTALIEHYEELSVQNDYFENYLSNLIYKKKKLRMRFREPIDKYEWAESPLIKNSFYDPSTNGIIIPIAEIQDPFFTPGMPLAVNYGGIGMIVGHELAHSFDSIGMLYDEFGNKFSWHTKETNKAYEEKVKCFVDQYDNFTFDTTNDEDEDEEPIQINGLLTKNENIADNVGLEVAFAAFQKRLLTERPQPRLPGLTNITDEQLFFLSYANAWCTTSRESYEKNNANIDIHTPPRFRIIGSTANMASFSSAFNCAVDSPMNRESKCSLWI